MGSGERQPISRKTHENEEMLVERAPVPASPLTPMVFCRKSMWNTCHIWQSTTLLTCTGGLKIEGHHQLFINPHRETEHWKKQKNPGNKATAEKFRLTVTTVASSNFRFDMSEHSIPSTNVV